MARLSLWMGVLLAALLIGGCKNGEDGNGSTPLTKKADKEAPAEVGGHGIAPSEVNICFESQNRRVPIIMYHDLIAERNRSSLWYDCSVDEFETQMKAIQDEGFTVISLDLLYDHLSKGATIPEKSIVLTFDDNYQSFYDLAWPIVKRYQYPVSMFVHTGFVGKLEGRAKMSWETLRELSKDELFTVGGHTINHFLDLKDRSFDVQKKELEDSKVDLESNLDIKVDYLAYPNGSNGADTQILARDLGYKMAFTIVNTPAEESPNIYSVGRYVHTKFTNALKDRENAVDGAPADVVRFKWNKEAPVRYEKGDYKGVPLRLVFGGRPSTVMSDMGREPVIAFVNREQAAAGINGGFFAMAAVASTDNAMVGPLKTPGMMEVAPDNSSERWVKINNRPLVIWSDEEFALLPYVPAQMNQNEQYEWFMKEYTDTFMGGVWLVHKGIARSKEEQNVFGAKDIQDYRRRAFIGITKDGQFVAGAAIQSVSSEKLAAAIADAGVEEAVLIDSGFSTSLVFDGKIKASGHSTATEPSRPVPHAIIIKGTVDPVSAKDTEDIKSVSRDGDAPRRKKRRR